MLKIWARTMVEEKITRSIIFKQIENYDPVQFDDYVMEICHTMDIPTPIILNSHFKNFHLFNTTKFVLTDFVESIDFDKLILENCKS